MIDVCLDGLERGQIKNLIDVCLEPLEVQQQHPSLAGSGGPSGVYVNSLSIGGVFVASLAPATRHFLGVFCGHIQGKRQRETADKRH